MKRQLKKYAAVFIFLLPVCIAFGQQATQKQPGWVSANGYWVVEGNIHSPLQHTIRFYNNDHLLVGKKEISGMRLNVNKRRVKMKLKAMLETSLLAWEKTNRNQGTEVVKTAP
jgi:hypothetical protein